METLKKVDHFISVRDESEEDPMLLRSNHDLKPTPPEERTWRKYNYILIWFQSTFNVNEWNTGASLMKATALPHGQIIGASILGIFLSCFFTVINARSGSDYHVGYPALARATFGVYGGYFFVFVRCFVAEIWFGVQTYYGARCFDVMMRCMFGYRWTDIPNQLPESAQITTRLMLAFFLYWLIQFPLMWCHPRHIRYFFTVKAFIMPLATLGLFLFCVIVGHGPGNWDIGTDPVSNSSRGNQWMLVINTIFGTLSPMIINQPDVSRYARNKNDTVIPQAIGFIPPKIAVLLFGMVSSCSIYRAYGEVYWSMWDLLDAILDHNWTPGGRTGIWFVSAAFAVGTAGTNIFANSIPFAADVAGLLPKYFTILRAQIMAGLLCWAIVPWKFLSNAAKFITFLGSYSIFVGPLLGAILADFYIIRRGNIHIPSLYTKDPKGAYYFYKGWNVWGALCWCVSPVMAIPGLYRAYYPDKLSQTASDIYTCGWLYTFLTCFVLYAITGKIMKPKIYPDSHSDEPTNWEHMVDTNGFFEDDLPINGVGHPGTIDMVEIEKSSMEDEEDVKLKAITSIKSTGGIYM